MKRIYISCYENHDSKYKDILVKSNEIRGNKLFTLIDSNPDIIEKDFSSKKEILFLLLKKIF